MMLAASSGWFQQFSAWAHSSILGEVWLQNALLFISATVAIATIIVTSLSERRRATVDFVRDLQKDSDLVKARKIVSSLQTTSGKIDLDPALAATDSENRRAILEVLNSFEFMAGGIHTHAFDEKTYKYLLSNTVVTQWSQSQEFVKRYREVYIEENKDAKGMNPDTLFQDFEILATDWSKHPLKQIRTRWNPFKKKPAAPIPQPHTQPQPPVQAQAPVPPQPIAPSQPPPSPLDGASI